MGQHSAPVPRDEERRIAAALIRSGMPSDDDLDRRVGLDRADPLADGQSLLDKRIQYGPSAEDIAAAAARGTLDALGIDDSMFESCEVVAAGRHVRPQL
jgi:hypothetical protein